MKYAFLLFLISPMIAHGATVLNVSKASVTYTESYDLTIDCDTDTDYVLFNPDGVATGGALCTASNPEQTFSVTIESNDNWIATPAVLGTYTYLGIEANDACITSNYDGVSDDYTNCYGLHPTPIATFQLVSETSSNTTWGSDNGFWGDTTPTAIIGDMEASVQATGANIWPLMAFVGIPIAFLIAIYLIWLINKTLTPVKRSENEVINPNGEDFIYHSAEDLEFKREYGQVKRKRGRPRKNPL